MSALYPDRWTVVATRMRGSHDMDVWAWIEGYDPRSLHQSIERGDLIVMHRRNADGKIEMVARFAGPNWRRMERMYSDRKLAA